MTNTDTNTRAASRRFEKLLRGNYCALQSSVISDEVLSADNISTLSTFATKMAQCGYRIAHQRLWCKGHQAQLDNLENFDKLLILAPREHRFAVVLDSHPGEPLCGLLFGPLVELGPRPEFPGDSDSDPVRKQKINDLRGWIKRSATRLKLATHPFELMWQPQHTGSVVLIRWFTSELPKAGTLPEGHEELEAKVRGEFVSGHDCAYVPPPEWEL